MLKTNKDLVFYVFVSVWIIAILTPYLLTYDGFISICIVNPIFGLLALILTVLKCENDRFNNWLEKNIKK